MPAARPDDIVSKGEFAVICNVSAGRVSQWIKAGQLSGDALVGEGRAARIRVPSAQAQLKRHLDPNQMTANGIRTRIPTGPLIPPPTPPPQKARRPAAEPTDDSQPRAPGLDLTEERARLAKEQADHTALKNAALRGELIPADEAERRWSDEMVALRAVMLGAVNDIPAVLPHLSTFDISEIDRVIRARMIKAANERAPRPDDRESEG